MTILHDVVRVVAMLTEAYFTVMKLNNNFIKLFYLYIVGRILAKNCVLYFLNDIISRASLVCPSMLNTVAAM